METRPFCWSVTGRNLYVKSLMESFLESSDPAYERGEAAGIEPAQDFNRHLCVTGKDTLACPSVREGSLNRPRMALTNQGVEASAGAGVGWPLWRRRRIST